MNINDEVKAEFYDQRAKLYSDSDSERIRKRRSLILIKEAKKYLPNNILELGVGTGRYLKIFDDLSLKTYGLDLSSKLIDEAKLSCPNSELTVGSIHNMPYDKNQFSMINVLYVTEHVLFNDSLLQKISLVLKKGGKLNITFYKYKMNLKSIKGFTNKLRSYISVYLEDLGFPSSLNQKIIPTGHLQYSLDMMLKLFERNGFTHNCTYHFNSGLTYLFCFKKK